MINVNKDHILIKICILTNMNYKKIKNNNNNYKHNKKYKFNNRKLKDIKEHFQLKNLLNQITFKETVYMEN